MNVAISLAVIVACLAFSAACLSFGLAALAWAWYLIPTKIAASPSGAERYEAVFGADGGWVDDIDSTLKGEEDRERLVDLATGMAAL